MIKNQSIFAGTLGDVAIKQQSEDFQVNERIRFVPEGEGDHLYLYVKKIGENTEWVQRQLAKIAGISAKEVGYAGLKDRHAITQQWFSVYAPNNTSIDFSELPENITITGQTRGRKKLKTAAVQGNEFIIGFDISGLDKTAMEERFTWIKQHGFANYFGAQRFGHGGKNIDHLLAMAHGKRFKPHLRSIYISAGRSFLFNQILSERVRQGNWNQWIPGDVALLNNTRSIFPVTEITPELEERLGAFDLHPALPLYGSGDWPSDQQQKAIEQIVYDEYSDVVAALQKLRVDIMPRASRVIPENFSWQIDQNYCELKFELPAGAFATTLLEQVFSIATNTFND